MHLKRASLVCVQFAFSLLLTHTALAGAWTRGEGEVLIVAPVDYSVATESFDGGGNRVDRPRFEKLEVAPLLEYGLTDYFTIGAQPKWRRVSVDRATGGTDTNSGFAEADILGRLRLWSAGEAALSVQGLVKLPIDPDQGREAALGFDQVDVEGSVLFGNRHVVGGGKVFYNFDLGFRKRFDEPSDEIHGNGYVGWWTGGLLTVAASLDNTIGLHDDEGTTLEALTAEPGHRRHRAGLSLAYRVGQLIGIPNLSVVAGASTTYAGENVGATNSGFVGLVFTLAPAPPTTVNEDIFRTGF
jgi:hypothetical protein